MILASYAQFRLFFAAAGASVAQDGFLAFPGPQLADGSIDNTPTFSLSHSLLCKNDFNGSSSASRFRLTTQGGTVFEAAVTASGDRQTGPGELIDPSKLGMGDLLWPFTLTINAGAPDAVPSAHDYDWWLSQQRDPGWYPTMDGTGIVYWSNQLFTVTMPDATKSGTIQVALNSGAAAAVLPGKSGVQLAAPDALTELLRDVHIYVRRRNDRAYQWAVFYSGEF